MSLLDLSTPPAQVETPQEVLRQLATVAPETPFGDIALALSGGGFRAAAFSLGAMCYLNRAWMTTEDDCLLKHITFITSTSGGSLTNSYYSASVYKPGFDFNTFYANMKVFMNGEDLLNRVFDILTDPKKWNEVGQQTDAATGWVKTVKKEHNLINAFAKAYDEMLFTSKEGKSETLDVFFDHSANPHLKTVCFNATELNNGIAFRFQTNGYPDSIFTVGNYYLHFNNADVARKLKLSDLAATSSCFPSGFEPMVYPYDYIHPGLSNADEMLSAISYKNNNPLKLPEIANKPFCMMDGGVVDNQGLGSMMMEDNFRATHPPKKPFDVMMVCDVGSYFMDQFVNPTETKRWYKNLTINKVNIIMTVILVAFIAAIVLLFFGCTSRTVGLSILVLTFIPGVIYLYLQRIFKEQKQKMAKTSFGRSLIKYIGYFFKLRFTLLQQMMASRAQSMLLLNLKVFLAQERRQAYNSFYTMPAYKNRAMSCFIYEFSVQHNEVRLDNLKTRDKAWWPAVADILEPSPAMQTAATAATAVGTTLWFNSGVQTDRDTVIACGQFTMCYNLLKRIYRLEVLDAKWKDDVQLQGLKARLLEDWKLFKANPFFMV
ncbi:patatin-like phospholipase family protein [Mucilaginibacter sp. AW1-3]